jgi:hypothetical protein
VPAPDLVVPIVAFRAWRIVDGRLLSPYIPCRWEGAVMHAECYPANRSLQFGCGWLEGIVAAWGHIESHHDGLRAQHARVCALARRPGVDAIASDLGVDLVERDELEAAAARYGAPLPPSLVP